MGDDEFTGDASIGDGEALQEKSAPRKRKTTKPKKTEPTAGSADINEKPAQKTKKAKKTKTTESNKTTASKSRKKKAKALTGDEPLSNADQKLDGAGLDREKNSPEKSFPLKGQAENGFPSKGQMENIAQVHNVKVEVLAKPAEKVIQSGSTSDPVTKPTVQSKPASSSVSAVNTPFAGKATVRTEQTEVLPFRAIKIRNIVAKILNLTAEIIPNKVIVQGILHEQIFFVGTDNLVHHLADDSHFSTFVDIPGVQPGMNAQVDTVIEEIIPELAPDGLTLIKKFVIEVFVKVTETVQLNLAPGAGPTLLLDQVIGENTAQTLLENDVELFVPALKVDEIVGSVRDLEIEVINDKVIIQGTLHKQIFFVDTANLGRHQAEDIHFSLFVDIPGAAPGVDVTVNSHIEAIFFELITSTTLRQKAVIEFFVKVTERVLQPVTVGSGPLFKVEEFVGDNTVQELSESLITLFRPAIKVREIVARLQNLVTHVISNKVIVQGVIHKQIFFIGTDNIEYHQAEDIPFSLFLDVLGAAAGDNIHLDSRIEAVFFELVSATDLRQKVILSITATVTREVQLNLVIGTGMLFKLEQVVGENTTQILLVLREVIPTPPIVKPVATSVTVVFPGALVIGSQQIVLQNTFPLPVTAIKIKDIQVTVNDVTFTVVNQQVLVQGVVQKTISFVGTDNIVRVISENVPFSVLVNVPDISQAQNISVTVDVEDVTFTLNPEGTAVTQIVVLKATVQGEELPLPTVNVVTSVTGPGITTNSVLAQGLVVTPGGPVFEQFNAVTDVFGPGIVSITKQTVLLQLVGEPGPTPVTVVTNIQFADP